MSVSVVKNSDEVMVEVFIADSTGTATNAGLTGLVFNTASLTAYYYRGDGTASVALTLATMTLGTWVDSGFKEVDATNMPGVYQIGLPDALVSADAESVTLTLQGATNMMVTILEVDIVQPAAIFLRGRSSVPTRARLAPGRTARQRDFLFSSDNRR